MKNDRIKAPQPTRPQTLSGRKERKEKKRTGERGRNETPREGQLTEKTSPLKSNMKNAALVGFFENGIKGK